MLDIFGAAAARGVTGETAVARGEIKFSVDAAAGFLIIKGGGDPSAGTGTVGSWIIFAGDGAVEDVDAGLEVEDVVCGESCMAAKDWFSRSRLAKS